MQPSKPDSRIFASYPMPAKIDLLNERPRRESLVEQQLENRIEQISPGVPRITVNEEVTTTTTLNNSVNSAPGYQQIACGQTGHADNYQESYRESRSPTGRTEVKETRIVINRHSGPVSCGTFGRSYEEQSNNDINIMQHQHQQLQQQNHQQQERQIQGFEANQYQQGASNQARELEQSTVTTDTTTSSSINKVILENELAQKEALLRREIDALSQRPYSPCQTPGKIDITTEQRVGSQQQYQYTTSPRPNSSASTTSADLLEKEAKLLKEIEEIESKPYNPQTMLVEREKWYEYPENRPDERHLTDSKRRVRDFCSMPTGLCHDQHIHEENLPIKSQPSPVPSSIHTTIIRSPKREIDNKSPLPFAFDNFTTKGVRGNIATVGAVEPDRPRAPIFPIVKRTPSPAFTH